MFIFSARLKQSLLLLPVLMTLLTACDPASLPLPAPVTPTPNPYNFRISLSVYPNDPEADFLNKVSAAKTRAYMKMYMLTDFRMVDALAKAKKSGADVRAIVEQDIPFAGDVAKAAYDKLTAAGIPTKYAGPAFKLSHEKSYVIDGEAIVDTANMTFSAYTRNREFAITTANKDQVDEIAASFLADWNRTAFTPTVTALVWSPENARVKLSALVKRATKTLDVYAEIAQDKEMQALLVDRAQNGVAVRFLISPNSSTATDTDAAGLDQLQRGGVKVRYLTSPYVHAKVFVVDGALAYVGSHNFSRSSLELNRELGIIFSDQTAIVRLWTTYEADWAKGKDR
ncbi:MAG: phospholipase D-like domain-containing protein [Anaerolineae bacterium]